MSLGAKLRELRREKNWSQGQLGIKIGIHEKHISRYENDKSKPSTAILRKIADVFGVSVDYLLSNGESSVPTVSEFKDQELLECFLEADKLDAEDRNVVKKMVQAFVVKQTVENLARKK